MPRAVLPDVHALQVAPDKAAWSGHLVEDRVAFGESVRPGVAALGFAAGYVTARRAHPQVEPATALLAPVGLRLWNRSRQVFTRRRGAGEAAEKVHAPTVGRGAVPDCEMAHALSIGIG
jgi:hypothetical protein